jgi:hypothetical protein
VLVHGAFADSSSWTRVIQRLQSHGIRVTAAANPRRGISIDSAYIANMIDQIPGRVIAVGDSYDGAVNSNAASMAKNVVGVIFVAAFARDEGEQLGAVASGSKDSVLNTAQVSLRYPTGNGGETAVEFAIHPSKVHAVFAADLPVEPAAVMAATQHPVSRGQTVIGGLCQISSIRWADGSERPWIDGIDPALLEPLTHFCRMCCTVFVYMFSGMRDSEVQSLKRGCVEPFWGHLTLTGKEFKTFRGAQARWVVIEPVARGTPRRGAQLARQPDRGQRPTRHRSSHRRRAGD